jgi:hypothetical protein
MIYFNITNQKEKFQSISNSNSLNFKIESGSFFIETSTPLHSWHVNGDLFLIIGSVVGKRNSDKTIQKYIGNNALLEKLAKSNCIDEFEGRFVVISIKKNKNIEIWTDNYGRIDVYYTVAENNINIASGIDLIAKSSESELDSVGVAHSLIVYGSRPAKKHTLYQDIKRLGVFEGIKIENESLRILKREVKLLETKHFIENDLNKYADLFIEAIRVRSSDYGNIVYLSSGWDSTSILATLVHLYGKKKTRCVIGRMQYSDRSGVINQFEIDRAMAISNYFGVKLDIIEFDYRKGAEMMIEKSKKLFFNHHFANMTSFNHWILAEQTAKTLNGSEVVFAGEMSDGAHNLGFSQYATIFHPSSFDFREYSDKMLSYLHGPTFYKVLQEGAENQDPIWQIFRERNKKSQIDQIFKDKIQINRNVLSSFFLRSGRLPYFSIKNSLLLTSYGQDNFIKKSEETYLNESISSLNSENYYSTIINLYNSFHWQGSTVSTLEYTADFHGFKCVLPFHDKGLIDFLSEMPENFGRGLDLNPTKYPLKWMLKNRIDYPMHLQTGPHSYTYDIIPDFSLIGEIMNQSSFKPIFIEALKNKKPQEKLNSMWFDKNYLNNIINKYISGQDIKGPELNDLSTLSLQSVIELY